MHGPSVGQSPIGRAVLRAVETRYVYPTASISAALGRRSWSGVLRFAEHVDALARGWDTARLLQLLDGADEAHEEEEDDGADTVIQKVRPRIASYYRPNTNAVLDNYTPYRPYGR